jgi:HK97 family phage major capsid protein
MDLYDEAAVERETHRRLMFEYQQSLDREQSVRRAQQGGELVYRPGGPHSWWIDNARSALHGSSDPAREKRLQDHRHQVEHHPEYRGINATGGTGGYAVPPYYAEGDFVIAAHALSPIAAAATNLPLPAHTNSVVLPQLSTGITAAVQTAQNATVTDGATTYADAGLTCPVTTLLGSITMSRQLLDFATPSGYDEVIARELGAALGAKREQQIIAGTGGSGQLTGIENQSGVPTIAASGSVAGVYDGIVAAIAQIATTRFRQPDFVAGSPELWAYLAGGIDTSGRPFMPPRPSDQFAAVAPESCPGEIAGLKYISDPSIAASLGSQYLVVGVSKDLILWSRPPEVTFSLDTLANQMSVVVTASQYAAFGLAYASSVVLVGPFSVPGIPGS